MTPKRPSRTLRERLRAMTGRSRQRSTEPPCVCTHDDVLHVGLKGKCLAPVESHPALCECSHYRPFKSRVSTGSFEHTHRVVMPEPPPRRWFVAQGISHADDEMPKKRRWFNV